MTKSALEISELVLLSVIFALTLLGNCLVILAFILGPRSIRTFTNYFVVNLAVSDLMVGCSSLPFWITFRADYSLINDTVYKYFIIIDILFGTASILSLAAISLERMFAVKFPAKHFNLTALPVIIVIVATWTIGIVFTGSRFSVPNGDNPGSLRLYTAFIFALAFLVPLFVIIISYCIIFHTAVTMMKATNQHGTMVRELHVAKTISVIIGLFILCWMPFFIVNMLYVFCKVCGNLPFWLIYVTKCMHYSNSMMNFFVYAVRSPDFKRSFKAILFKCDTSILRERIRTFSESISRSRSSSERLPHDDNNCNHEPNRHVLHEAKARLLSAKTSFKQSRLSNHSTVTEISMLDESSSSLTASTSPYLDCTSPYLDCTSPYLDCTNSILDEIEETENPKEFVSSF